MQTNARRVVIDVTGNVDRLRYKVQANNWQTIESNTFPKNDLVKVQRRLRRKYPGAELVVKVFSGSSSTKKA